MHTLSITDGIFYIRYRLRMEPISFLHTLSVMEVDRPTVPCHNASRNRIKYFFNYQRQKLIFCIRYRLRKEKYLFCARYRLRRSTDPRSPATASPEIEVCIFPITDGINLFFAYVTGYGGKNYARMFFF